MNPDYSTESLDRIARLERMRSLGVDPYASTFSSHSSIRDVNILTEQGTRPIADIIASPHSSLSIAGRVMLHRSFGKICFMTLSDGTGKIQIMFSRENCSIDIDGESTAELVGESERVSAYKFAEKFIDLGDFIGVTGELFFTHKGERTLFVERFTFLTKAIRPLPEKFHGMEDDDERYRKRYLDMAMDDDLRQVFYRKSLFWDTARTFMKGKWFLEVETPTLEVTTWGAEARPFRTHHHDFDIDIFLRISIGELWQKRLMAGGFPKTFEIGRAYRNEGSSPEHLQEFTNMEFYWSYADYRDGMRLVQELYQTIAQTLYGRTNFISRGHSFDLAWDWPIIDYLEIIREKTGIDIMTATEDAMKEKLEALNVKYEGSNRERLMDTLWKYVRRHIAGPVFLIHHPKLISPLAKESLSHPWLVERFQPVIAGTEVGNGFSELNNPFDQRDRFMLQQSLLEWGDEEAMMPDWEFVEMLEHGMPPTCGFGFWERLFAILEDKPLRECQYFPLMKPRDE